MNLTTIFKKPVDRPIEGVIKADDLASLRLEVEEYVLTNEVEKRLENFLDAYNNYEGANGVWISGFFGSGKSHLLKMLALLLENRSVDGIEVLDAFIPKCQHNEILMADLKKACAVPSSSILFNIDQKAAIISKKDVDALLAVFVKVFDEMCGYYGKQAYIAQFERDLDSRDLYETFKEKYAAKSGISWSQGREEILFEADNIASAYSEATGASLESGQSILDKYRSDYALSIEDFAEQINAYIEQQEPNFRLNFFVDEVGQYIAENTKLMTNLQTVAESLATKCRGRAWVIVTAQEDMNTVVGEMGKQQSNDFSKIQARFSNRLKLTSQDVAEVIQKRLLMKNDEGVESLSELYHKQQSNFKTLFDFSDGSQSYKNFKDRDHFIQAYPFIPFQFTLFQASIQSLSSHNAFEGQHSSVGERSMLGVFQQVVVHIADHKLGQLATFDLMFEGIRTALKANTQRAVLTAEKNLDNAFAIQLLKALFLVKYVKGFKPTIRNLCVLMLEGFDQNLGDLKQEVEQALNLLEQQTYIQRNGEVYEFLTDEEKDVEEEIKQTDIENSDVADELSKIIFDQILRNRKIRYDENGQDYAFSRKLDDRFVGREYELAIHVVSPFHEHSGREEIIRSHALGKPELTILMQPDDRIYTDLVMYKKTEKYVRHNQGSAQQESISRILAEKANQNRRRMEDLKERTASQVGKAIILVSGDLLELNGEDAVTKVTKGFHELIARVYPNLRMLRKTSYKEQDVSHYLNESGETLFGNDAIAMSEPEQEMLAFINSNNQSGVRTTLKLLVEQFEKKPYGWHVGAILCILAKLCARAKVEARQDSTPLEDQALVTAIRNTAQHANLVLLPQVDFSNAQIRALQEFFEDFFDTKTSTKEPKSLGNEIAAAIENKTRELEKLTAQTSQYPFLSELGPAVETLQSVTNKSYTFYLTDFMSREDELLDLKERVIDPLVRFMNGSTKVIYDETRTFLSAEEANFSYLSADQTQELMVLMEKGEIYRTGTIQQIKTIRDSLTDDLKTKLVQVKNSAEEKVNELQLRIANMDEFAQLDDTQRGQIEHGFDEIMNRITRQSVIAVVNDSLRQFEDNTYPVLIDKVMLWSQPKPEPAPTDKPADDESGIEKTPDKPAPNPPAEVVPMRNIQVDYKKPLLNNEQDVETYVNALQEALNAELAAGKRVRI
ncbi:MAG: BREX system P-loop protein BrxC [Pontiella sp.]